MKQHFSLPLWRLTNIRIYYLMTIVHNCWWIMGNWIFFWTRYMTYGTLGLIDALAFAFGVLMEVPTGAVADLIGKRKTVIAGMGFASAGIAMMTFSMNQYWMLIGFLIAQLGWALYSGAAEAIAYDTLLDNELEDSFEDVISRSHTLGIATTVTTVLLGGVLYNLYFQLPHIMWFVSFSIGTVFALFLTEPASDSETFSLKNYIRQMRNGIRHLVTPKLREYTMFFFFLYGGFAIYDWGLVKPALAEFFGFDALAMAVMYSVFGLAGAIIVSFLPAIRKRVSDHSGLYLLTVFVAVPYMLMALPLGYYAVIAFAMIDIAGRLVYPWLSVVLNRQVPSKDRATTISTAVLLGRLPYVIVAIAAGQAAESGGLGTFSLMIGAVIVLLTAVNVLINHRTRPATG
ncbi:MAG: Major Facilitator Superfamily protein [candidate division WS6 bacterium OLB20]|uniref:Major Facilitator Superfamily protein n=1 Tax=candidate division WS6 bacterium OLB20 TaxID=1617426 RepID=A0A136LZC4_9BACT|nr:MAG: Major Facilitator Superfamily protein [candidate division WS6 bacterium OLB20]